MILDISPTISEKSALFPGEVCVKREVQCDLEKGDDFTLSSLSASVHVGAHADARCLGDCIASRNRSF